MFSSGKGYPMAEVTKALLIPLLVAEVLAGTTSLSAQPGMGPGPYCGNEAFPPLITLSRGCRWECVQLHWKKVCASGVGLAPGGRAEIHKKNVPKLRQDHVPGRND